MSRIRLSQRLMLAPSICLACAHRNDDGTCTAFPSPPGIPTAISRDLYDHRNAWPGDGGVRFLLAPGSEPLLDAYEKMVALRQHEST